MNQIVVISAYRQLDKTERKFVDGFILHCEQYAVKNGERISNALHRDISASFVNETRGLLSRPIVQAAIAERINDLAAQTELTSHKIIKELSAVAFSSLEHFMTFDKYGLPDYDFTKATPEQLSALSAWEEIPMQFGGKKYKFKTHDKLKAIELLMKYMGLLQADNNAYNVYSTPNAVNSNVAENHTVADAANSYSALING